MDKITQFFGESDKEVREKYFPDYTYKGTMVEVGGATPVFLSMSRHFKLNGWRCIIVEPNPKFVEDQKKEGNEVYSFACSDKDEDNVDFEVVTWNGNNYSFSAIQVKESYRRKGASPLDITTIKVNVRKLDTILADLQVKNVDFLSIDTEGWELEVMGGFNVEQYKPKVIMLENWLHSLNYASYMESVGYTLDHQSGHNYIFVRK